MLIPVNEPLLTEADYASVMEALRSGWISGAGPHIEAFEARWAAYCGRKHGIALANGTVALQVAVALLDLQPGDEVIMPTFTIISCALPVVLAGAIPVLVDSEPAAPGPWTSSRSRRASPPRTRAIMPVHIYGHPVDMDPLLELAQRHDLRDRRGRRRGARRRVPRPTRGQFRHSRAASASTPTSCSPPAKAACCWSTTIGWPSARASLRNLGFQPGRRFLHDELGFNFRLTNLQAALGVTQVERMDEIVARKRRMGQAYTERLSEMPGLELQVQQPWARSVYWMYGLVLREETGLDADEFARRLASAVASRRGRSFSGMHEQPVLRERGLFAGESYPVAERIARQGLYLPSGLGLEEAQIDRVCQAVARGAGMTAEPCSAATTPAAYDDLYQDKDYVAECDLIERVFKRVRPGAGAARPRPRLWHGRARGGAGPARLRGGRRRSLAGHAATGARARQHGALRAGRHRHRPTWAKRSTRC